MQSITTCLGPKYATFSGRAPRSEYGWFWLIAVPGWAFFSIALGDLAFGQQGIGFFTVLGLMLGPALVVPTLAVTARRLHDMNASGWWQILPGAFGVGITDPGLDETISVIAFLFLLSLTVIPGKKGKNHYGPDPRSIGPWNA